MRAARLAAVLSGAWAGMLLCIALIATPAPFATLLPADAGRVVSRIFTQEAYVSLGLALALVVMERRRSRELEVSHAGSVFSANLLLLLGTLFCTVAGYFAVQPLMVAARAGSGPLSFGALHAVSLTFFAVKGVLVFGLAWNLSRR